MISIQKHILFEDPNLIVINKPAGLLSQGEETGDENLVDLLRTYFGRHYVGLVHRLDRNTSGLMVIAKRTKAAQRLTEQLQDGKLERIYYALLQGALHRESQTWEHWLLKNEKTNTVQTFPFSKFTQNSAPRSAKQALLHVRKIEGNSSLTLAEFKLETGRSHQIRAQAQAMGYSLLGDTKYGGSSDFPRPALHSARLSFDHPISKERLSFEAPLPADMAQALTQKGRLRQE